MVKINSCKKQLSILIFDSKKSFNFFLKKSKKWKLKRSKVKKKKIKKKL